MKSDITFMCSREAMPRNIEISTSPIQNSSLDDSNSARLSICSAVTLSSSVASSSPNSPCLQSLREESSDLGRNAPEGERLSTLPTVLSSPMPNRRRRTALLLDQPSKTLGNPQL